MKSKMVIVMGSSRSFGNTRRVVDEFISINPNADLIDLNLYEISYYDYEFRNASDDFHNLIIEILDYETIVFATPIYWYTMSAQLKMFFDRISDVLQDEKKEVGKRFRGKNMAVISCGCDGELFEGFAMPFEQTANYLGMVYLGHLHAWVETDFLISTEIRNELKKFAKSIG